MEKAPHPIYKFITKSMKLQKLSNNFNSASFSLAFHLKIAAYLISSSTQSQHFLFLRFQEGAQFGFLFLGS